MVRAIVSSLVVLISLGVVGQGQAVRSQTVLTLISRSNPREQEHTELFLVSTATHTSTAFRDSGYFHEPSIPRIIAGRPRPALTPTNPSGSDPDKPEQARRDTRLRVLVLVGSSSVNPHMDQETLEGTYEDQGSVVPFRWEPSFS